MNRIPKVNVTGMGEIIFRCSDEASSVANEISKKSRPSALSQTEVHTNAVNALKQKGVKDPSLFDIRGQYQIQLGKYIGQTFFWLLENDIGYASFLIASSMREGSFPDTPLGDTKKQLKLYMESFPAGRRALQQKKRELEEKHASKISTKNVPATTVSQSSKLVASNLSPHVIAKWIGKTSSPPKFKPNIPSSSIAQAESPASELGDEKLLSIGLSMEAKMPKTLPAPRPKKTVTVITEASSVSETKTASVSTVSKLSQLRAERPFTGLALNEQGTLLMYPAVRKKPSGRIVFNSTDEGKAKRTKQRVRCMTKDQEHRQSD